METGRERVNLGRRALACCRSHLLAVLRRLRAHELGCTQGWDPDAGEGRGQRGALRVQTGLGRAGVGKVGYKQGISLDGSCRHPAPGTRGRQEARQTPGSPLLCFTVRWSWPGRPGLRMRIGVRLTQARRSVGGDRGSSGGWRVGLGMNGCEVGWLRPGRTIRHRGDSYSG